MGTKPFFIVTDDYCLEETCKELLAIIIEYYKSKGSKKQVKIFHCFSQPVCYRTVIRNKSNGRKMQIKYLQIYLIQWVIIFIIKVFLRIRFY